MERDLRIRAEVIMHIQHTLMAAPGVKLSDLKRVRSTQLSLNQCEKFINRYGLEQFPASDTASSARDLAAHPEPDLGVIASKLAAQIYKLDILEEEIKGCRFQQLHPLFILGGKTTARSASAKPRSFSVPPFARFALSLPGQVAERNIAGKIESRPRRDRPWRICFTWILKATGKTLPGAALLGVAAPGRFVKMLGSYPISTRTPKIQGRGGEELMEQQPHERNLLLTFHPALQPRTNHS